MTPKLRHLAEAPIIEHAVRLCSILDRQRLPRTVDAMEQVTHVADMHAFTWTRLVFKKLAIRFTPRRTAERDIAPLHAVFKRFFANHADFTGRPLNSTGHTRSEIMSIVAGDEPDSAQVWPPNRPGMIDA